MPAIKRLAVLACALAAFVPAAGADAAITTTTIDYGPFTIPAGNGEPHNHSTAGMISNEIDTNVQKPCTNCTLISITPDLVYTDGSEANIEDGPMLHHTLLAASGGGKSDATCAGTFVGMLGERFFASGNERTVLDLTSVPYGYEIGGSEQWNMVTELMNWETTKQKVEVRMTYKYATGSDASSRDGVRPVWLDLDQCGDSEVSVPSGEESDSHYDWEVNVPGELIATAGHIHDHGVRVELTNESAEGASLCNSEAGFGGSGYETPDEHPHVSSMGVCIGEPLTTLEEDEELRLHAIYDVPEGHHEIHNAMGIMLAYIDES
jgi:hypothetical protein